MGPDRRRAQDAHPDPPVAGFPRITAGVQWRRLLRGALVADFALERPAVHVDLAHIAGGLFSFFSELSVKNRRVRGYVKPLLRAVDVPVQDPRASTWQVIANLIQDAFFEAILPGFRQRAGRPGA